VAKKTLRRMAITLKTRARIKGLYEKKNTQELAKIREAVNSKIGQTSVSTLVTLLRLIS